MLLFHITPEANLPSIKERGLLPGLAYGISSSTLQRQRKNPKVWLTDNVPFIVKTQLTREWIRIYEPVIIEVDVTNGLPGLQQAISFWRGRDNPVCQKHEYICDFVPVNLFVNIYRYTYTQER